MSAALYALPYREIPPMTTEPAGTYDAPKSAEPHRTHVRTTYCPPVGIDCLMDMLRMATKLRTYGEPFSFEAACVSYMLDQDKGTIKAKTDYDRQWGWSKQQRRSRWLDLLETVGNWTTFHGKKANPRATPEQPTSNPAPAGISSESQSSNPRATDQQPPSNLHTNQTQTTDSARPPKSPKGGRVGTFEEEVGKIEIPGSLDSAEFRTAWRDWIESRRTHHPPANGVAGWRKLFEGHLKKLLTLGDAGHAVASLRESTFQTWQGVFAVKGYTPGNGATTTTRARGV
jgi:hypothetical protein